MDATLNQILNEQSSVAYPGTVNSEKVSGQFVLTSHDVTEEARANDIC